MFLLKTILLSILLFTVAVPSVLDAPAAPDHHLQETEATLNRTFTLLGLHPAAAVKVNHYAHLIIQNFLTLLTLRDHSVLKDITNATRANKTNDNETLFMADLFENMDVIPLELDENKSNNNSDAVLDEIERIIDSMNEIGNDTNKEGYRKYSDVYGVYEHNVTAAIDAALDEVLFNESDDEDDISDDSDLWQPSGRRIFQGVITKIKHFPFMASIHVFGKFKCAGSIIKSDLVITAASCLQLAHNNRFFRENPEYLKVRVGSSFYSGGGETIPVLEVYFYPAYHPVTLKHNLAIMRLRYHIHFKKKRIRVKRIEIDRNAHSLPINTENITVVGWGARKGSNTVTDPYTDKISFRVMDIYSLYECRAVYNEKFVGNQCFCAGRMTSRVAACNHDLGGPGIVDGILTGIISFGSPACGQINAPTVFVKLGFYTDWIEEVMSQEVQTTYIRTTPSTTRKVIYKSTTPKEIPIDPIDIDTNLISDNTVVIETQPVEQNTEFVLPTEDYPNIIELSEDIKLTAREGQKQDKKFENYLKKKFGSKEDISGLLGAGMRKSQLYKMFLKNIKSSQYDNISSKSDELQLSKDSRSTGKRDGITLSNSAYEKLSPVTGGAVTPFVNDKDSGEKTSAIQSNESIAPLKTKKIIKEKKATEYTETDSNYDFTKLDDYGEKQELHNNDNDGSPVLSLNQNTKSKLHKLEILSSYSGTDEQHINTDRLESFEELNGTDISHINEKKNVNESSETFISAEEPENTEYMDKNKDGKVSVYKIYSIEEESDRKDNYKREKNEEMTNKSNSKTKETHSFDPKKPLIAKNIFNKQKMALKELEVMESQLDSDDGGIGVINLDEITQFDDYYGDSTGFRRDEKLKQLNSSSAEHEMTDDVDIEVSDIYDNYTAIDKIQIPEKSKENIGLDLAMD